MAKKFYTILFTLIFCQFPIWSQIDCADNESVLVIDVMTDQYPQETSWILSAQGDSSFSVASSGYSEQFTFHSDTICVPTDQCLEFYIADTFGDGICCSYGDGFYTLILNGDTILTGGDYGTGQSSSIACPPGQSCSSAFEFDLGESYTSVWEDTWYQIDITENGQFLLDLCDNECPTALWIYDYCTGLQWEDSPVGAIYNAYNGCDNGLAMVTANLEAGKTYFVRIGDLEGACIGTAINWSLSYLGPIVGCTDPSSCTFDPLAEVNDANQCFYPGSPDCPSGPDLIILEDVLRNSIFIQKQENNDECYVLEQCMNGYGERELLKFTTHIENIGDEDFYIGPPPSIEEAENLDLWEWDPCHGHMHYEGYAEYVLFDSDGLELPVGFKTGFCVMDLDCSMQGGAAKFGCGNQGITKQCGDIYSSSLACQWIDVTDLEEDIYTMVVRTNWNQMPDALGWYEQDYDNNWAQVCIDFKRDANGDAYVELVEECDIWTDCLGDIYGEAQPDCKGECAGPALRGDINEDGTLGSADVYEYLNRAMDSGLDGITTCTDLNDDGLFTVTDGILALACSLQGEVVPGSKDHCELPFTIFNPNETVYLSVGEINHDEQYIDIEIQNAQNSILSFQFETSGIEIVSVEEIGIMRENVQIYLDHNESKVLGMVEDMKAISKQHVLNPFLRLHYTNTTDTVFCLSNLHSFTNKLREEVATGLVEACGSLVKMTEDNTSISQIENSQIKISPNPFVDKTILTFDNPTNESFNLKLFSNDGKLLREYKDLKGNSLLIKRENLVGGVYYFNLSGPISESGKLIIIN